MKKFVMTCYFAAIATVAVASAGANSFETVLEHYEPIRLALLEDSMDGVNDHGKAVVVELRALKANFSADRAGASGEAIAVVREKLAEMIAAADAIASATSLKAARDGFYNLTKPMVLWRQGVADDRRPAVAYCPMHKRSWLQPDGEIGNPYGGMPRCGEIVSK